MANNTELNPGDGGDVIDTEELTGSSTKIQRVKVTHGDDGIATSVSQASPLPVAANSDLLELAKENIAGSKVVEVESFNEAVGTSEENLGFIGNGITSAETLNLVSDDGNDVAAGTGARTVLIEGLDGSYLEISETITLTGATPVVSTKQYLRVHNVKVVTAGSGGGNAGVITVIGSISSAAFGTMAAGVNSIRYGSYTIPAGKTGYLVNVECQAEVAVKTKLMSRLIGSVYTEVTRVFSNIPKKCIKTFAAKTDFKLVATNMTTGDVEAAGSFTLVLVDD